MIEVLQPGFYSSIQDLGRYGYLEYGVPLSGAMDQSSLALVNALLQNSPEAAAMEITMTGPSLKFLSKIEFAITGANMSPKLNDKAISNNTVLIANIGDVLSFGKLQSGFRSYIGVKGGFGNEMILESRSMYQSITKHSRLLKDELITTLEVNAINEKYGHTVRIKGSISDYEHPLMVYKGPEYDLLNHNQVHQLRSQAFTISQNNNRMGYQLNELIANELPSIITAPVMPGTIQLTPSGTLIVLMRDCQTTGGYPRILQLSEQAINHLSQKYMGRSIRFKIMDYE